MVKSKLLASCLIVAFGLLGGGAAEAAPNRQAAATKTAPRNQHMASPSAKLVGAAIKQRAKSTGQTSGKIKLQASFFKNAPAAELRAMEADFALAGIELTGPYRSIDTLLDFSYPRLTWNFRAVDVRAKPNGRAPTANTVIRLGKAARAKAYAEIKEMIDEGLDQGQVSLKIGGEADKREDAMTFIYAHLAPMLLKNDGIELTSMKRVGESSLSIEYKRVRD